MSRGPGRVQAGILEALMGGLLDVWTLALTVQASEGSTRRALRALCRAGRVACLGYGPRGKRWGLPEDVEAARALWTLDSEARVAAVLGARFMRSMRRTVVGML